MHSIAAPAVAAPNIPIEWITSGVVTPVGSPAVGSPAAAVATSWSPHPAVVSSAPSAPTMRDAIVATMSATAAPVAEAQRQLAMTVPTPIAVAAGATAPLASMQVAPPPTVAPAAQAAPPAQAAPAVQAAAAAPAPQSAPAAGAAAAPQQDPTLVSSVAGAIAGFASATGKVAGAVGDAVSTAAGSGVAHARRVGTELWAGVRNPRGIHISQVPSKFNKAPAAGNRDCGPASVAMTLRLLGKHIPGVADSASPQKLINRVRALAGNVSNAMSTTNHELARALRAAGAKTREIADAVSIRQAVLAGKPVVLNGNPRHPGAYGPKFSAKQMTPYDGAHWIVVSGFDEQSGKFIINDPLSKIGAVKVTPAQLEAYRGGSLGIEVTA